MADSKRKIDIEVSPRPGDTKPTTRVFLSMFERIRSDAERSLAALSDSSKKTFGGSIPTAAFNALSIATGNLISGAITKGLNLTNQFAEAIVELGVESVKLAGDFEATTNAMTVFAGSSRLAKAELEAIDKAARNTDGLRLEGAEKGYAQLRALGFQAETTTKLIVGLGKQKLLSPLADESAINRVIVNLTQLSSGSSRASQDIKETIHALPGLRSAFQDAFGTVDPKKLKGFFETDPDKAIQKLADSMAKLETPAAGLNTSLGKLSDAGIELGRAFGEPLLDGVTSDVKSLTSFLYENQTAVQKWGQNLADTFAGVRAAYEESKNKEFFLTPFLRSAEEQSIKGGGRSISNDLSTIGQYADFTSYFREKGKKQRQDAVTNAPKYSSLADYRQSSPEEKALNNEALKAREDFERRKALVEETAKQQSLAKLKSEADEAEKILQNRFSVEQALRDSNIRYTAKDEIKYLTESGKAKNDYIKSEIGRVSGFYNKQIELQSGNDQEITKLQSEKNKAISGLEKDLKLNAINTLIEIQKQELKIYEDRRKAAIDFNNLQLRQSQSAYDKQTFDLERSISAQSVSAKQGYDELKKITQTNLSEQLGLTRENYALQLQDKSLTDEQIKNLTKQGNLDLLGLAEQNRRSILEIERKQTAAILQEIQDRTDAQIRLISNSQLGADSFSIFGDVNSISSFSNFNKLLEKAKELKIFFEQSNRGQADFLKNQSDYYKNLANQAQSDLERLQRARASMLPNAETNGGSIFTTDDNQNQSQLIDKRMIDADVKLAEMQNRLIQYKGIASKFGTLATQFNSYADGIEKTYGTLQSEVFDLYDSINKGIGDNTVFDQIIEKNYLAQRALEQSALAAKVTGLANQLSAAQKALSEGSIAPLDVIKIQGDLTSAEQALKAFNFQTDLGVGKLDLLTNAIERVNKLKAGDKGEVGAAKFLVQLDFEKQNYSLMVENIALEQKYYQDSEYLAEQRKNKLLNYEREVFELRQELNEKSIFSQVEFNARILEHISQSTKSITEIYADSINTIFDKAKSGIDKLLDKAGIGKIPILGDIAKGLSGNFLSKITTGILDQFGLSDLKSTGNPQLDAANKQLEVQKQIEKNTRTAASITNTFNIPNTSQGLGGISGILHELLHSGSYGLFGGQNSNNPLIFSNNGLSGLNIAHEAIHSGESGASGSGGIFSNLKNLFSTKEGGIFAPLQSANGKSSSSFGGYASGAGSLVALAGSLIGGRVGGFLSNIGSGVATGAQIGALFGGIGAPIGTLIGGGIGLLQSLFSDPKRKKDKQENLPALNQGFVDALQQLRQIAANKSAFYQDPENSIAKALEIRQQIASGFGITFQSSKYKKESQSLITAKLVEADGIIAELNKLKDRAVRARDIDTKLQTSFATGVYADRGFINQFTHFKRRNGLLTGGIAGRDSLPSYLMPKEMVLNEVQQNRIRAAAGHDIFRDKGIPNYATGTYVAPSVSPAAANFTPNAPQIIVQPQIIVVIEGEGISNVRIKEVLVDNLKKDDVQVEIVKSYDRGKSKTRD